MCHKSRLKNIFIHTTLVTLFAFSLYLLTIAPTVLWGDDAELQRLAILKNSGEGIRNYWLWGTIAHEFTKLPFGDIAWRVNLSSAVFAALTVGILFIIVSAILNYSLLTAWATGIALAISHTFWLHAVRAEVYAFFTLLLAIIAAFLLAWHKSPRRWPLLSIGILLISVAFLAHLLIVTFIPAVIALIICTKKANAKKIYLVTLLSGSLGFLLYWLANQGGSPQINIAAILSGFLKIDGKSVALWLGFLGYQFLLLTPIGLLGLTKLWQTDQIISMFFIIAFLGNVVFALSFRVPDQYVFYLPSYMFFALWIGNGLDFLSKHYSAKKSKLVLAGIAIIILSSPLVYRATPLILNQFDLNLLSVRTLPNRNNNIFFFYPPKNGYDGARIFGETVMEMLPEDAALLADWLPLQTLTYFQEVEHKREDIVLVDSLVPEDQLAWLLEQSQIRPVFIADNERYYDLSEITQEFKIISFGPIFSLEKR